MTSEEEHQQIEVLEHQQIEVPEQIQLDVRTVSNGIHNQERSLSISSPAQKVKHDLVFSIFLINFIYRIHLGEAHYTYTCK